jgi:hypothetical protein
LQLAQLSGQIAGDRARSDGVGECCVEGLPRRCAAKIEHGSNQVGVGR